MEKTIDQAMGFTPSDQRTQSFGTTGTIPNPAATQVAQIQQLVPIPVPDVSVPNGGFIDGLHDPVPQAPILNEVPPVVPMAEELPVATTEEIRKEVDQKKDEIKADLDKEIPGDEQRQFIDKMVDELLTENEEQKFTVQRYQKQVDLYKAENDTLRSQISESNSDTSKVSLSSDIIPVFNVLNKYNQNKEDKNLQFQAVQALINHAGSITGADYSQQISDFYTRQQKNQVSSMSGATGAATNMNTQQAPQSNTDATRPSISRGVTKSATSTKRF